LLILVRGVGNKIVKISKYILIKIYINSIVGRVIAKASIIIEVYIIEDLKVNILIRNSTPKP